MQSSRVSPCHVGGSVPTFWISDVRRSVCRDLSADIEVSGHHYCVLHAPTLKKDISTFDRVVKARIKADTVDLRGVWFPNSLYLSEMTFQMPADFSFAYFHSKLYLWKTRFEENADFWGSIVCEDADFSQCEFVDGADFRFTTFRGRAHFDLAEFGGMNDFHATNFLSAAIFNGTRFTGLSDTQFTETVFSSVVAFNHAALEGKMLFKGSARTGIFNGERTRLEMGGASVPFAERVVFEDVWLDNAWLEKMPIRNVMFENVRWKSKAGIEPQQSAPPMPLHMEYIEQLSKLPS